MSNLFVSLDFFLSALAHGSFESRMTSIPESCEVSPLEEEQYGLSRCTVVEKTLRFSEIILAKHTSESSLVSTVCRLLLECC